jgi:hypothetical protein
MLKFYAIFAPWMVLSATVAAWAGEAPSPGSGQAPPDPAGVQFFENKVRPLLVDNCYKCHSADAQKDKKLKGELLLDTHDGVLKGGENGPAIVPGKPNESRLIKAVRYTDDDLKMPPKVKLTDEAIADLEKWVAMGAPDPRQSPASGGAAPVVAKRVIDLEAGRNYWAFRPLAKVGPPQVKDTGGARTPIDRFILARQEEKGIVPNGPAERRVLIRRAYFDLNGLPPTPKQVDDFVNDTSSDAWEKVVDGLLASDRYGERWARHWLDVARFAESNGYEFDADRPGAWQYRDFVIRALNQDMPWDQFVRWQIAGDKLAPDDFDARAATGFLVAGPSPGQITAKTAEPLRYDQLDDMIATLGSSMLGLTVGCCRCHDHKYDPLPQQDYYRLAACFADTDATELKLSPRAEQYREAEAKWKAEHDSLTAAWEEFQHDKLAARVEQWEKDRRATDLSAQWLVLDPDQAETDTAPAKPAKGAPKDPGSEPETLKKLDDGSLSLENRSPRKQSFTFVVRTQLKEIIGLKIEALADKTLSKPGPGIGNHGEFLLTRMELQAAPLAPPDGKGKPVEAQLTGVKATSESKGKELSRAVDTNPKDGWAADEDTHHDEAAAFQLTSPVGFDGGTELTITLHFDSGLPFFRPRLSVMTAGRPVTLEGDSAPQGGQEVAALLAQSGGEVTDENRGLIARWLRTVDPKTQSAWRPVQEHQAREPHEQPEKVFAAGVKGGRPVFYLGRGEVNKKNGLASIGFAETLETASDGDEHWTGTQKPRANDNPVPATAPRVALANWITDTDHGAGNLLARVAVNRLWQHHMGRGIVNTPNDFGVQGDAPTNPELLDYLAGQLIDNGWKLKPLHRLIMTSAVYMQGNAPSDANMAADPENKLWWRRPPQRLEAEAVRDSLLAASGTLQLTMYGPGTLDETSLRRSIYLTVKRSKPVQLMQLFDAPEASQSIGKRQVTTLATQALTLLNSPFVREQAQLLAKRVRPSPGVDLPTAIEEDYRLTLCRRPTGEEKSRMLGFIDQQEKMYGGKSADVALVDVCQILLCSSEFVYIE